MELDLPIKNITWPFKKKDDDFKTHFEKMNGNSVNVAFEIDLSKRKALMKALGLNKWLDCYPILWVFQNKQKNQWTVPI